MMHTLGKVGFQQSYTYYTWRNSSRRAARSTSPSSSGDAAAYMRPSFWPTTHDILTPYMQFGGPAAWKLRAVLAATLVPTYGIYAGYELMEHVARPGAEEQIDNEKYEYKDRHWEDYEPGGPKRGPLARRVPHARSTRSAARTRRCTGCATSASTTSTTRTSSRSPSAAGSPDGSDDVVVVVANLDPHSTRATTLRLDMGALGLRPGRQLRRARPRHRRAAGPGSATTTSGSDRRSNPSTSSP